MNDGIDSNNNCRAEEVLKMLSGKWKPQIFRLALDGPVRFSALLRDIPGSNKQAIASALKELEEQNLLQRKVITEKPLHVEYSLTERGRSLIAVFQQLEQLSGRNSSTDV